MIQPLISFRGSSSTKQHGSWRLGKEGAPPQPEDRSLALSLAAAASLREVQYRPRAGPKTWFPFCVVWVLFHFPFTVLEDLGSQYTRWQQLPMPGISLQPLSGRHTGVVNTEIVHDNSGGLGHGYREEGRPLRAGSLHGPEEVGTAFCLWKHRSGRQEAAPCSQIVQLLLKLKDTCFLEEKH